MRPRDFAALSALAALWGVSYLFIRLAGPAMGTWSLMALRFALSGVLLWLVAASQGQRPRWDRRVGAYLGVGAIGTAIPGVLVGEATLALNASLTAILSATTPLLTAMIVVVWFHERLDRTRLTGLLLGLVGVGLLVGWSPIGVDRGVLIGVLLAVLATVGWALGAVITSRYFTEIPLLTLAAGQQLGAGAVLVPFALANPPAGPITTNVVLATIALTVFSTALGYLLYFGLIQRTGPTSSASVSYLIPVSGLFWGAVFLSEPVGIGTILALMVILSGIMLVTGARLGLLLRFSARPDRA